MVRYAEKISKLEAALKAYGYDTVLSTFGPVDKIANIPISMIE